MSQVAIRTEVRGAWPIERFETLDASLLPPGYVLDASDPDVLFLLRPDGTTAAVFSARGVSAEGILEAAAQDSGRGTLRGILRQTARRTA